MELDGSDDDLLAPLANCIKTENSLEKSGLKSDVGAASNTVLLLEQNVKEEQDIDTVVSAEDPLNIVHKLDMKMEKNCCAMNFQGEYNESDFFVTDPPNSDVGEQRHGRSKRGRISASEMKGRSGFTWSTSTPLTTSSDRDSLKAISPQCKGPARLAANMLEAWNLLFDEPILTTLVIHTNEEIKRRKSKSSAAGKHRSTDLPELRAWIGLNYLCGVFCVGGGSLEELWTPELGNGIFRATMSLKRFEFLSDCVRLSEGTKKSSKRDFSSDIQEVASVWEKFIINCRSYYAPTGNCTLDEYVIDMAATDCPTQLLLNITDKPGAGIRLVSLHDAKSLYMCNAIVGRSSEPTREEALTLICDIKGTGRNITFSKRYTSFEIANNLLQSRLTMVGSLSEHAVGIPAAFLSSNNKPATRKIYSGKMCLIASDHYEKKVLLASGISQKIDAEKLYAGTAQSGQRFYEKASKFSTTSNYVSSASKIRWTLSFFNKMLDFACFNAWVLFRLSQNGDATAQQRDFQRQLGLFLTQQHLKKRLQRNSKIPLQLKLLISEILGESLDNLLSEAVSAAAQASSAGEMPLDRANVPDHVQLLAKTMPKRGRCRSCPSRNNIKTRWQCQQCGRAFCLSHLIMRCNECTGITKEPEKDEEKDPYFK